MSRILTSLQGLINQAQHMFGQLGYVSDQLVGLYQQLIQRLSPLIEHFKPILQDPLWQLIGIIIGVLLVIIIILWGVKYLKRLIVWIGQLFVRGIRAVGSLVSWPWRTMRQWFKGRKEKVVEANSIQKRRRNIHAQRAANAIKFLITRREWRYHLPWTLLIGEEEDGRQALIASVKAGRRSNLLPKEKQMLGRSSGWHFFDHGVVIESTGADLPDVLNQLHWYRPERAVDNIVLVISAKTLLNRTQSGQSGTLDKLGESLFQHLWQVQKTSGFVLPVYVFISDCDQVEGFDAFWQAQPENQLQQMIGWSTPYRLDSAFRLEWVNEAFASTLDALQQAQLRVASGGEEIAHIDQFMLFLHRFSKLEKPLTEVMKATFTRSGLQEAPPFRGVYFCGKLAQRTAFVEEVFQEKIFAERNLASMIEKRRFSTNQLLRRFQIGTLVCAIVATGWLGFDIVRFYQFNQYIRGTYAQLTKLAPDDSATGANTYQLLIGLNNIGQHNLSLVMPLSWLDLQEREKEQIIARNLLEKTLFVSLEQRLKERAKQLTLRMSNSDIEQDHYWIAMQKMQAFKQQLLGFEQNQDYFALLASPMANTKGIAEKLSSLLNYLYDNPVPEGIDLNNPLIVGAVRRANYPQPWIQENKPLVSTSLIMRYLDNLTLYLHRALIQHVKNVPIAPLQRFNNAIQPLPEQQNMPPASIISARQDFQDWLAITKRDWLSTSAANSPCTVLNNQFAEIRLALLPHGFFNAQELDKMQARFSPQQCDQAARQELAGVSASPFGSLFQFDQRGLLSESPALKNMLSTLDAINQLHFVRETFPPMLDSSEPIMRWQPAPLQQLVSSLLDYQHYTAQYGASSVFAGALQNRLQQVTQRLLSASMIHPSQEMTPSSPVYDLVSYREKNVSNSVKSFIQVRDLLLQIITLLRQQGDYANVQWLNQQIQEFVFHQLKQLDQLVGDYHLYQPLNSPQWQQPNFTQALFDIGGGQSLDAYLTNQRQRLSYFAYNNAQPLLVYIQNSNSGLSNERVQRWLATLQDLADFERGVANNTISSLGNLISKTLNQVSNPQCATLTSAETISGKPSWFAIRQDQIVREVALHCSTTDQQLVIKRYLQVATLFNQDMAGKFPFANPRQAGGKEVTVDALQTFLETYRQDSQGLLEQMTKAQQKDYGISSAWLTFIQQMDQISDFMEKTWDKKAKTWRIPLAVTFNAPNHQGKGNNQIIQWTLNNGKQQAEYPNGDDQLTWQPGEPLQLTLRWAEGSSYRPQNMAGQTSADRPQIQSDERTATFTSQGIWGLFQWLNSYNSNAINVADGASMLSFYVPVGLKGPSGQVKPLSNPAYVSRSNILLQAQLDDKKGKPQTTALPLTFPTYAPALND